MDAIEFLSDILKREKCSVIAIGPMTNIATLIERDRDAFRAIDEFVSMGGAFKSHGNCSPVAEYNYWCDPDAAKIVYQAASEEHKLIHMIGLDVTREIVFTPTIREYLIRLDEDMGNFIKDITGFYYDFHWKQEHILGCVINDPLAVAYFIDRDICSGFASYVDIVTDGIAIGQSVVDSMDFYGKEPNAYILTQTNTLEFFKLFISTVLNKDVSELDLLPQIV